jgi:hypothetical protein
MIQGAPANVVDFGAVGNGVADDTVAIQAALNASAYVLFPAGKTFKTTATLTVPTTCYRIDGAGAYMTGPGYASSVDGFYFTGFQQGPSTYPTWHEAFRSRNYSLPGLTKYRYGVSIVDAAFLNIETELISFCTSGLRIEATAGATSWAVQNIFNAALIVNCTNAVDLVVVQASVVGIQGCTIAIEYVSGCNNGFLGTFFGPTADINYNIFKVGNLDGNGAANNPVYTYANAINFNYELTGNINSWLFDSDPINMVASVGASPYINVGSQEIVQAGRFIGLSFAPFYYENFLPGGFRTTSRPAVDTIIIYVDQSVATTGKGSAASPYKTIAEAVNALFEMDGFGRTAKIQLVAGTYSEVISINTDATNNGNWQLLLAGVASTPASVTMIGGITINGAIITLQDLTITTTGLLATKNAYVTLNRVNFGAVAAIQIDAETNSTIEVASNYTISGAAAVHAQTGYNGQFLCMNKTVTITGTPAFSSYFAFCNKLSYQDYTGTTFSGSATGVRALVNLNSAINTNGGGASFLPGSSAVVTTNGGQYV